MSISTELSSDIAVALLKSPALKDKRQIQQIMMLAHSALKNLSATERYSPIRHHIKSALPKSKGATLGTS